MNLTIGWRYNYDDDQAPVTWTDQLTELWKQAKQKKKRKKKINYCNIVICIYYWRYKKTKTTTTLANQTKWGRQNTKHIPLTFMIKNNVIDRYYYVLLLPDRCRLTNATDSMMINLYGWKTSWEEVRNQGRNDIRHKDVHKRVTQHNTAIRSSAFLPAGRVVVGDGLIRQSVIRSSRVRTYINFSLSMVAIIGLTQ